MSLNSVLWPITVIDTFLTALPFGDSAFTGYGSVIDGSSLLLANSGGPLTESLALIRFIGRGDTVVVQDTARSFSVDSVKLNLALQDRDTTKTGLVIDVYRLPVTFDTLTSFAMLTGEMVPTNLLKSVPVPDGFKAGTLPVVFSGAELAKLVFVPADTTRLVIGLRLRAPSQAGAYVGRSTGKQRADLNSYTTSTMSSIPSSATADCPGALRTTVRAGDLPLAVNCSVGGFPGAKPDRFASGIHTRFSDHSSRHLGVGGPGTGGWNSRR